MKYRFVSLPVPSRASISLTIASLALALVLGGCASRDAPTGSIGASVDYRQRHPIVIGPAQRTLSIYPMRGPGGLDARQLEDVEDFIAQYRSSGSGRMTLRLPQGANQRETSQSLGFLKKALVKNGIPANYLETSHYEPMDPAAIAPIKLGFSSIQAKLNSQCGLWTEDLASGSSTNGMNNRPYDQFGCTTQQNFAAQVDDPLDLVRPRRVTAADLAKRRKDIEQVRDDADPSTKWNVTADKITTN